MCKAIMIFEWKKKRDFSEWMVLLQTGISSFFTFHSDGENTFSFDPFSSAAWEQSEKASIQVTVQSHLTGFDEGALGND